MKHGKIAMALVIMLLASVCFAETSGSIAMSQPSQLWGVTQTATTTTVTTTSTTEVAADVPASTPSTPATTTTLPFKTQTWQTMTAGSTYTMASFESSIGFTQLNITMASNANNVAMTVRALGGKPVIVTTPQGMAYKYVEVIAANLPDSSISSAKIQFHIEKWWLNLNRLDKNSVHIYRWNSGIWQNLTATKTGENDNYALYAATTPGFSVFAITADSIGSTTTTISGATGTTISGNDTTQSNTTGNQTGIFPEIAGSGSVLLVAVIVAVIIVIAAVLYMKKEEVKKFLEKLRKKGYRYHEHKPEHHESSGHQAGSHKEEKK